MNFVFECLMLVFEWEGFKPSGMTQVYTHTHVVVVVIVVVVVENSTP